MKKSLFALLVLVSTQGAFARSLMPATLTFDVYGIKSGESIRSLDVYANGRVVTREKGEWALVATLTSDQMRRIDRLVQKSSPEIMRFERTFAKCIVAASTHNRYAAVNGRVKLRDGDICDGGFHYNARPAAKKLVNILNALDQAAHQRANLADVEARIEAVLQ